MGNTPTRSRSLTLKVLVINLEVCGISIMTNEYTTASSLIEEVVKISSNNSIISLCSHISDMLDYVLTLDNNKLDLFQHNDVLFPVYYEQVEDTCSINAFFPVKVIGKGGFSTVTLARKKDTGKLYAIKTVEKSQLVTKEKIQQIVTEKDIMKTVDHPFIVELMMSTQSKNKCYLIMEF